MSPVRMAKVEEAMRVALAFQQAFNRHDADSIRLLLSDDCRFESHAPAPDGAIYTGKEAIVHFWQEYFHRAPAAKLTVEEIFGYGQRCILRWRCEWKEATGEAAHLHGVDIFLVKNGLVHEQLSYSKT